ncbi:cysteine hydrolase family protein [Thermodesulfobacteriota bacterium]
MRSGQGGFLVKEHRWALIVVDMQNDFVMPGAPFHVAGALVTIPRIREALDHFRERGHPVFHVVREYRQDGSDVEITRLRRFLEGAPALVADTYGSEIVCDLAPRDGEYRVVKKRFSAFMFTELDLMLRRLSVTGLVVCGTQLPVCVRETVFDAVAYGYECVLLTDGSSARTEDIAKANIRDMRDIGVACMSVKEFISAHLPAC